MVLQIVSETLLQTLLKLASPPSHLVCLPDNGNLRPVECWAVRSLTIVCLPFSKRRSVRRQIAGSAISKSVTDTENCNGREGKEEESYEET